MHRSKCCSTAVLEFIQNLLLELGLSPELWSILTPVPLPTGHPLGIVPFSYSFTLDSSAAKASPCLPAFSFCFNECCTDVLLMLTHYLHFRTLQELNLHLPSFLHIERCLCLSVSFKTMTRGKNLRVARKSTVMTSYNLTYPLLWSSNVCQKLRILLPCLVHGLDIMFRAKTARSCLGDLDWNLVTLLFNVWWSSEPITIQVATKPLCGPVHCVLVVCWSWSWHRRFDGSAVVFLAETTCVLLICRLCFGTVNLLW